MNLLAYTVLMGGIVLLITMVCARKLERRYAAIATLVFVIVGFVTILSGIFVGQWNGISVSATGTGIFGGAIIGTLLMRLLQRQQ